MSEENNILLAHLEELRAVKDNFERFSREKNNEIARAAEDYEQVRRSLEEALVFLYKFDEFIHSLLEKRRNFDEL